MVLLLVAFICLQVLAATVYGTTANADEIMGYTTALLEVKGFPGAYSDDNVVKHGIANGQTVVNILEGKSYLIGEILIPINTTMIILHNTSAGSPTQTEVDRIGDALWDVATKVDEHYPNIDVSIRVNPGNAGPFGNNKPHFNEYKIGDGQVESSHSAT